MIFLVHLHNYTNSVLQFWPCLIKLYSCVYTAPKRVHQRNGERMKKKGLQVVNDHVVRPSNAKARMQNKNVNMAKGMQ